MVELREYCGTEMSNLYSMIFDRCKFTECFQYVVKEMAIQKILKRPFIANVNFLILSFRIRG